MSRAQPHSKRGTILLVGSLVVLCLTAPPGRGADFGRLSGTVTDTQGEPLMGATVLIAGPLLAGPHSVDTVSTAVERVITDAHGRFRIERLVPGWYSLRVSAATRVPAVRDGIRVQAGRQASEEKFVLTDIFAAARFQVPVPSVSTWGDDWKWILRTSATTRPILRYQETAKVASPSKDSKPPLRASTRMIGMLPGSPRREALARDQGLGSVLAYLRPLSENADLLVTGLMTPSGVQGSSLATALRTNLLKGDPQEVSLAVHQLSFAEGLPVPARGGQAGLGRAQAVAFTYAITRQLSDSVRLTTGFVVDYLDGADDALVARPSMKLEYRLDSRSVLAVRYGSVHMDGSSTLLERVGMLNAFPRVTLRNYHPEFEISNHAEVSLTSRLRASQVEIAAYRDRFQNAAVYGFGGPEALDWLAGDALPNPVAEGWTFNAGNYHSSGLRAAYSQRLGRSVEATFLYALGEALMVRAAAEMVGGNSQKGLRDFLRPELSRTFAGKVSARIPVSKTQIIASYESVQRGRVTGVDPYGQANLQLQPYLGVQIRQPLPTLAFLPAHIEAVADFRNLLAQGYAPLAQRGPKTLLLTSAYRSFRGGFSVQF